MPLCVCYSCGGKMDCDPSGICELCEDVGAISKRELQQLPIVNQITVLTPPVERVQSYAILDSSGTVPDDRQILNILQRLHQNILRENEPYVSYAKACRWQFTSGMYECDHVKISEAEVIQTYQRQMEN